MLRKMLLCEAPADCGEAYEARSEKEQRRRDGYRRSLDRGMKRRVAVVIAAAYHEVDGRSGNNHPGEAEIPVARLVRPVEELSPIDVNEVAHRRRVTGAEPAADIDCSR